MAKSYQIIEFLRPDGGWYQVGTEYAGITFVDCEPFTEAEYEAAFDEYDSKKAEQAEAQAVAKAALLERLGITEAEAKLLLA